jgi:hypothetical protein
MFLKDERNDRIDLGQTVKSSARQNRYAEEPNMQRFDTFRFALADGIYGDGIYGAGSVALTTICTLLGIPGFKPFTDLLVQFYGFYGYTVSTGGIAIGAFWGLTEGFVHFGIFAWLYNMLLGTTKTLKAG